MTSPEPIVYVVDDDLSVRQALSSLVRSVGIRVETFAAAQDFLRHARADAPSCLVLDVNLPDASGLDLLHELTAIDASIPVIFITGHGTIPMSVRAMKAGAVEFLTKPFREEELIAAIEQALSRDRVAREDRVEMVELRKRFERLTAREREVLALVIQGRLNKQIAAELGAAEPTVKTHRGRVMQKLRASSVAELVRMTQRMAGQPTAAVESEPPPPSDASARTGSDKRPVIRT